MISRHFLTRGLVLVPSCKLPSYVTHNQCVRGLLVAASGDAVVTIKEARSQLKKLVGSSKSFSGERDAAAMSAYMPTSQSELPRRRMMDSYREACIPLGTSARLREKYINFWNGVRFGRIMEDLDTMAVWISYTHNHDPAKPPEEKSPLSIVTAAVDKIQLCDNIHLQPDQDIWLRGHVSWAGTSSMEVTMDVEQEQNGTLTKCLEARFLMVARDPMNKVKAFVSPMEVVGPEEEVIFKEGEANKKLHIQQGKESLLKTPPNKQERQIIHDMFLSSIDSKAGSFRIQQKPEAAVWMERTILKNLIICFPQERNLYNKIFGGFLMRKAYEVGWTNACVYSKSRPFLIAVDDIIFRKPVEIGSLLYLSSQLCYTTGPYLQIKVHAEVVNPKQPGQHVTTNIFHYTFKINKDVPQIMPKSYAEYMMYLDGKRHFESNKPETA